ncbi:formate/nitrite transporter family protein [Bradyrhizobium sp. RDM12]
MLVLIGGAELFTGNNVIVMAWASGKVSTATMLRNWTVVFIGNFVGALGLVVLVFLSHHLDMNDGRVGLSVLNTAAGKIRPDVVSLFVKGILCNVLLCAAVWLTYAGRSVTDKVVARCCRSPPSSRLASSSASPTCTSYRSHGCR